MKESKQPKSINFGFENCEYAEIPMEHVESFYIRQCYTTKSYYPHGQGLYTYDVIDSLEVTFKNSFKEYSYPMFGNIYDKHNDEKCIVKDRIKKYPDICWFGIKYDNDLEETYQVKWQDQDDVYGDENKGQSYVEGGMFGDVLSVK